MRRLIIRAGWFSLSSKLSSSRGRFLILSACLRRFVSLPTIQCQQRSKDVVRPTVRRQISIDIAKAANGYNM